MDERDIAEATGPGSWDDLEAALTPGPLAVPTGRFAAATLPLHGGRLCLDLTYSAVWRATARPEEALIDYPSLLALVRRSGELDDRAVGLLRDTAAAHPAEASSLVRRAIELREAIYRIFVAHIARRDPAGVDLESLNAVLAEAMASAAIRTVGSGFAWDWEAATALRSVPLALPLWLVARSAAELLTSPELARVKRCHGAGCGWLFLDTSRNGRRRWCDMAGCGNRARVRAFAERKRAARAATDDR